MLISVLALKLIILDCMQTHITHTKLMHMSFASCVHSFYMHIFPGLYHANKCAWMNKSCKAILVPAFPPSRVIRIALGFHLPSFQKSCSLMAHDGFLNFFPCAHIPLTNVNESYMCTLWKEGALGRKKD